MSGQGRTSSQTGAMIDRDLKRCLGQMMKGVQVVGAAHDGVVRAYCSHWVCQVSFDEPIVMASVGAFPPSAASIAFTCGAKSR